jgi:outer membrane protein assembly factor BamB
MGDIQGQIAVADINGDGLLEVVATDARGNVAAFTGSGREVWERHVGSQISSAVTFGDVDGDGYLELAFGSFDGRLHVLRASTGHYVPNFPFQVSAFNCLENNVLLPSKYRGAHYGNLFFPY